MSEEKKIQYNSTIATINPNDDFFTSLFKQLYPESAENINEALSKVSFWVSQTPQMDVYAEKSAKASSYQKGQKPKLLFTFSRPINLSNQKLQTSLNRGDSTASKQKKEIEDKQPKRIYVYRSESITENIKDSLFNNSQLYKVLDLGNKQNSFYEEIDNDKDYYYFFYAENREIDNSDLLILKDKYLLASINDLQVVLCSSIHRVRLNKNEEQYFLERESLTPSQIVKPDEYKYNFRQKFLISPEDECFSFGGPSFNENSAYFKIRVSSTKSNKKIDFNLQYAVSNLELIDELNKDLIRVSNGKLSEIFNSKVQKVRIYSPYFLEKVLLEPAKSETIQEISNVPQNTIEEIKATTGNSQQIFSDQQMQQIKL